MVIRKTAGLRDFYPDSFFQTPDCVYIYVHIPIAWKLASYLPLVDGNPVGGGKPLVALDIIDSIPEVAKALGQVHLQQISQQIFQVWAEVGRKANLQTTESNQSLVRSVFSGTRLIILGENVLLWLFWRKSSTLEN